MTNGNQLKLVITKSLARIMNFLKYRIQNVHLTDDITIHIRILNIYFHKH